MEWISKILAGWRAAWGRRHAAFWPEDEVSPDEYVAELTGDQQVIRDTAPPRPHRPRHARTGAPTEAITTVTVHDLRNGPSPIWDYPTSTPPATAASLGELVRAMPPAPEDEVLAAPTGDQPAADGERKGPPTVVFEVVRPNIAAGLDPYLAGLPGYSDDPDAT